MAHYVMSDIHGEADRFHEMLKRIDFSPRDTLYILGDVIDRGPDGVRLLRQIMDEPNMVMLLGNHEYMCLQYYSPHSTFQDAQRWARNGNRPTLEALWKLREQQLADVLYFLKTLPSHLEITVEGNRFYLVHGFPGRNTYEEVWGRPGPDTPNPRPGCRVILGHTTVLSLRGDMDAKMAHINRLEQTGDHLRIFHGEGFVDIDCGCGHTLAVRALACLRLEDMAEFYT